MDAAIHERGKQQIQQSEDVYIDLDVESDGIPGYGSLLSVGAVSPWGDEFYRELKPTSNVWIPGNRAFCEQHGLQRERLLEEGVEPAQAMSELVEWVHASRRPHQRMGEIVLVAYNASYDAPWINLEMQKAGIENPFAITGYCIRSLAMALSQSYSWQSSSMKRLPDEIRPRDELTHHALQDAKDQQALHFGIAGLLEKVVNLDTL